MNPIVIIPTYNEKENITAMLDKVMSLDVDFDVLVVDDNSPDGTADLVKEKQTAHTRIYLLENGEKNGLGTAYIAAFDQFTKELKLAFSLFQITAKISV